MLKGKISNGVKFLRQHKKAIFVFLAIFIVGFALGYYVQILKVYETCVEQTANPNCSVFLDYF